MTKIVLYKKTLPRTCRVLSWDPRHRLSLLLYFRHLKQNWRN